MCKRKRKEQKNRIKQIVNEKGTNNPSPSVWNLSSAIASRAYILDPESKNDESGTLKQRPNTYRPLRWFELNFHLLKLATWEIILVRMFVSKKLPICFYLRFPFSKLFAEGLGKNMRALKCFIYFFFRNAYDLLATHRPTFDTNRFTLAVRGVNGTMLLARIYLRTRFSRCQRTHVFMRVSQTNSRPLTSIALWYFYVTLQLLIDFTCFSSFATFQ